VLERSFPRGLDVEVFTRAALDRMDRHGRSLASREHVTVVARQERPEAFVRISIQADRDDSDLRWTVDTPADLGFVRLVYRSMGLGERIAPYEEVVRWCRDNESVARRDDHGETWDPSRVARAAPGGKDR
jgi:spore coat polysaccharide biosynthesis protein SpsF